MLYAYIILCTVILFLLKLIKNNILQLHKKEMEIAKDHEMIMMKQKLAGEIIDQIEKYNREIKEWVEVRRENGSVSEKVESACNNISLRLEALSKASFIEPYMNNKKY
jgi:hypothetical protein